MAYLELVKGKTNLPKLVNLFVHEEITHIVIEYFKFKPFIVKISVIKDFLQYLQYGRNQTLFDGTADRVEKFERSRDLS